MAFCLSAGAVDDRLFNGVSVWSKPFKFALSLAVYFATLLVFSRYLPIGYLGTKWGANISDVACVGLNFIKRCRGSPLFAEVVRQSNRNAHLPVLLSPFEHVV